MAEKKDSFGNALSGMLGSQISMILLYPFDQLRLFAQLEYTDYRYLDLYRGLIPSIQTSCCSSFLYFYLYTYCRLQLIRRTAKAFFPNQPPTQVVEDIVSAAIAGIVNVLLTAPVWRANAMFRSPNYLVENLRLSGVTGRATAIDRVESPRKDALSGTGETVQVDSIPKKCPTPEDDNSIVETGSSPTKNQPTTKSEGRLGMKRSGMAALMSSIRRVVLSSPKNISSLPGKIKESLKDLLCYFYEENTKLPLLILELAKKDFWELWSGVLASLLLVTNPIIQFVCYDWLRRKSLNLEAKFDANSVNGSSNGGHNAAIGTRLFVILLAHMLKSDIKYFVLGMIAKFMSTITTYPMQIAQSRLRADVMRDISSSSESDDINILSENDGNGIRMRENDAVRDSNGNLNRIVPTKMEEFHRTGSGVYSPASGNRLTKRNIRYLKRSVSEDRSALQDPAMVGGSARSSNPNWHNRDGASEDIMQNRPNTILSVLRDLYQKEGLRSWYLGMEKKMMHTLLHSAFMFFFYEKLKRLVV